MKKKQRLPIILRPIQSTPKRSKKGVDGKTTYSEGINVGYRWFHKEGIAPLFPFGFGLSYTTFDYSGLSIKKASESEVLPLEGAESNADGPASRHTGSSFASSRSVVIGESRAASS